MTTKRAHNKIFPPVPTRSPVPQSMRTSIQQVAPQELVDPSLQKYRRSLVPQISLLEEDANIEPKVRVHLMKIYEDGKLKISAPIYENMEIVLNQGRYYDVEIEFYLDKAVIYGLTVVNSIYKSIIRLNRQEYRQGTYAPNAKLQTATFSLKTPSGMLARGSYTGESSIRDKSGKIYKTIKYDVKIVQND